MTKFKYRVNPYYNEVNGGVKFYVSGNSVEAVTQ